MVLETSNPKFIPAVHAVTSHVYLRTQGKPGDT
jgi:hypothetical protein